MTETRTATKESTMTEQSSIPQVIAARAYVQTRFFPPLPAEYGDLLVTALEEYAEYGPDSHVNIDPDLNPLPRDVQVDEDGDLYVEAHHLITILRAEHLLPEEDD